MQHQLQKILIPAEAIALRLEALAAEISAFYQRKELTILAVLNGSLMFAADLLRRMELPLRIEFLKVASYHGGTVSSGRVTFDQLSMPEVSGSHVLVLDDILDSGRTLHAIAGRLRLEASPASIRTCVLLSKQKQRAEPMEADYAGFQIEDEFVVGYGLDFQGLYRNLPYIGVLASGASADEQN